MKQISLILPVIIILIVIFFMIFQNSPSYNQPIRYNHKLHIDLGLACEVCHQFVREQAFASIPGIDMCMGCHSEALTDSPEEEKIRKFAEVGADIPWIQIYDIADHVFFSHRRHVTVAEIPCETCHGEVATREIPFTRPLVDLSMAFCLDCHADNSATEDCVSCHN